MSGMEIDRLEIAIEAQARQATSQIDGLYRKLGQVAYILNNTGNGYRNMAKGIGTLASSMQALARTKLPDYSKAITQLQALSKLNLNGLNKKVMVDVEVNAPKSAGQIQHAIEKALEATKVDGTVIADRLISEFSLSGKAAGKVQDLVGQLAAEMSKGFDSNGEMGQLPKKADEIINSIAVVIARNGSIVTEAVANMDRETLAEYDAFAKYMRDKSIYLSKDLRGAMDKEFSDDLRLNHPGLFSTQIDDARRKVISLEKEWEGLYATFSHILPHGIFADDEYSRAEAIVKALETAASLKQRLSISSAAESSGRDYAYAEQTLNAGVANAANSIRDRLSTGIKAALAETSKQLTLDIEVNQDKIVRDIQNAIKSAQEYNYDPIKIKLDTDKSSIKNTIRDELAGMNAGSLPEIAKGYKEIAGALATLHTVAENIRPTINSIRSLTEANMKNFDTAKFAEIANTIAALGSMPDVSQTVNRFVASIARLATNAPKIEAASQALPAFSGALQEMFNSISGSSVGEGITSLLQVIARLASSSQKIEALANVFPSLTAALREFFNEMANAPAVSDSTVRMTEALAAMSANGRKVGSAATAVTNGMKRINDAGTKTQSVMHQTSKATGVLHTAFEKFKSVAASVDRLTCNVS